MNKNQISIEVIIKERSKSFMNIVLPIISKPGECRWLQEGEIISLESQVKNELLLDFDKLGGVDFIQKFIGKGIRPIANRIQGREYADWKSMTIREESHGSKNTELKKRLDAIFGNEGFIYPWLQCHSYLSTDNIFYDPDAELLFSIVVKSDDLYGLYKDHPGIFKKQSFTEKDGTTTRFLYIGAETLENYLWPEIYIFDKKNKGLD